MTEHQLGSLTLALLLIVGGATGLGYLFTRMRQPRVVGEILAGIILGPTVLGHFAPGFAASLFGSGKGSSSADVLDFVFQMGLLLLLFISGVEVRKVFATRKSRKQTWWLLGVGTSLPFLLTLAVGPFIPLERLMGPANNRSALLLVLATAAAVTSIPVISKIFADLGILKTRFASLVLGVAMLEDIVLYGVLAVATTLAAASAAAGGSIARDITLHVVVTSAYMVLGMTLAPVLLRRLSRSRFNVLAKASPMGWMIIVLFSYTAIAAALDVKVIFGAFLAGFGLVGGFKGTERERIEKPAEALTAVAFALFIPVYFALVGYKLDLNRTFSLSLLVAFLVGSTILRFCSAGLAARLAGFRRLDIVNIAVTANARGGPGIVLATIAFDAGIIGAPFFTALVITAVLTSQISGLWLDFVLRKGWPLLADVDVDTDEEQVGEHELAAPAPVTAPASVAAVSPSQ
ncbi:MAG: cation:proton antiporter [Actinomycetota bacterium]